MVFPAIGRGRPGPSKSHTPRPLRLESLEDRCLLNAAVPLAAPPQDHILVQFRSGISDPTSLSLLKGTSVAQKLNGTQGVYSVRLGTGVSVADALAAYRSDPRVLVAEADAPLTVAQIPNDPSFSQLWADLNTGQGGGTPGIDIRAPQAWNVTTGNAQALVAVMDTGIDYDHPDLYQNIWLNQAEIPLTRLNNLVDYYHDGFISWRDLNDPRNRGVGKITDVNQDGRIDAGDVLAPMTLDASGRDTGYGGWSFAGNTRDGDTAHPNDYVGWNFVNNTNNPFDDNGHGTHVSGTIGAAGNNGVGVTGIDWRVQILACKFIGADGIGSISAFISALNYSIAHGARITNNSWAGASNSQILSDAINNARSHGQIFVAAAGNDASNNDLNPSYPSGFNLDNIVAVAALDRTGKLASFSDYGATSVDLAAPGVGILSTTPNNTYSVYSGTSMATPQVTGVLALVWGQHPSWTYQQVIARVLNTTTSLASLQGKVRTGGLLNAARAVGYTPPVAVVTPPRILSSTASGPVPYSLGSIRLTFDQSVNPATLTARDISLMKVNGTTIPLTAVRIVPNTNYKVFDLIYPTQTAVGTYVLRVGPDVENYSGTEMGLYSAVFVLAPVYTVGTTTAVPIPDVSKVSSSLTVAPSFLIGKVTVKINIEHTWDGDLYIHLQAPDGTDILLSNQRGGSGHNYQNTIFDDNALTSIRTGQAPFAGSYQPEVQLSNLNLKNAHGLWKIWVEDRSPGDVGTLLGWSMTFTETDGTFRITGDKAASTSTTAPSLQTTSINAPPTPGTLFAAPKTTATGSRVALKAVIAGSDSAANDLRAASLALSGRESTTPASVSRATGVRLLANLFARVKKAVTFGSRAASVDPYARVRPASQATADPDTDLTASLS